MYLRSFEAKVRNEEKVESVICKYSAYIFNVTWQVTLPASVVLSVASWYGDRRVWVQGLG